MIPVSDLYNKARLAKAKPIILAYVESDTAIRCFGKETPNVDHLDPDLNAFSWGARVLTFGDYSQRLSSDSQNTLLSLTQEEMSQYTLTCDNTDFYFSILAGREEFVGRRLWLTQGFDYPGFTYSDYIPLFLGTIQKVTPDNRQCLFSALQTINPVAPADPTVDITKIYKLVTSDADDVGAKEVKTRTELEPIFYTEEEWIYTTEISRDNSDNLVLFRCSSQGPAVNRFIFGIDDTGHPYLEYPPNINDSGLDSIEIVADFIVSDDEDVNTRLEFFADLDAGTITIKDNFGNVYVQVVTVPEFTYDSQWGTSGSGDGQFSATGFIAKDVNGNVYTTEGTGNNRIQVFDEDGVFLRKWGTTGSGEGEFNNPVGIAIDIYGNVIVSEANNHRVQMFTNFGVFIREWGEYGTGDGEFNQPSGVAYTPHATVLVVDRNNDRVQEFLPDGTFLSKFGSVGTGDGEFQQPRGIAVDTFGNIFVTDGTRNNVQKFSSEGIFISAFGVSGAGDGELAGPQDIAVTQKHIYICDTGNSRVQVFSLTGEYVMQYGTSGSGDGQFSGNRSLAIDNDETVYVSDSSNYRIQKFAIDDFFINIDFSASVPASDDELFLLEEGPAKMLNSTWCDLWSLTNTDPLETEFPDLMENVPVELDDGTWEEEITTKTLTTEEIEKTIEATEKIILPNSGRYPNPGPNQQNVILPLPYGNLIENSDEAVWVAPLIDAVSFVYCVAGWPIQSVANGNTITVYVDGALTSSGWTFDESNDYNSQGNVAILTFAADPGGVVSVRCNGKWVDSELLTNPVGIVDDWMDYCSDLLGITAWEKDATTFAEGGALCDDNSFVAAGVIQSNNTLGYWIKNILASFMGSFSFSASGSVELSFLPLVFVRNVTETIQEYEAISIKPSIMLSNIINQIEIDYALSLATVDKRFKNNAQISYFRTVDETGNTTTPGAKVLELSFDWNRNTASVELIIEVLFALYGVQRWSVDYQGQDFKFLPVEMSDQIEATLTTVRDINGDIAENVVYELREKVMNLDNFTSSLKMEQIVPISVTPTPTEPRAVILGTKYVYLGSSQVFLGE